MSSRSEFFKNIVAFNFTSSWLVLLRHFNIDDLIHESMMLVMKSDFFEICVLVATEGTSSQRVWYVGIGLLVEKVHLVVHRWLSEVVVAIHLIILN